MVVIRLQRRGTKKTPHHRIVVADQRSAQSSRVLEVLGYYDPSTHPPKVTVNDARVAHWVATGAQVSEALGRVLQQTKRAPVKAAS